ncbi:MAG: thioredoxin domain-containing protein [Desulfarculaceae bacterium]|nr:thioredoxin domain-containing protein [Desulfarculaceae bacterium]MCF8072003.1 thioredoxin domain-containing protein [Desulfarculaceae bacterium]MCF8101520.1 thioredoxin domain-containing protein [Desulfarculaceae bacterium]MCF8115070.1 thioredoxin domain-containing protein [Desulfarculaceae bacterium]
MANRLAQEKSPYLLQHANNPVDWQPWDEAARAQAKAEDKPIFLSIGYATCHWCHVMAHESFEDPEVAALLNRDYVAIKVDREERPDLDGVYMAVCQTLTGRGGWPLSVWLTPEGKPFYAGTYFPKNTRQGMPGFIPVLTELSRRWKSPERVKMISASEQIIQALQSHGAPEPGQLGQTALGQAAAGLAGIYDPKHGGFGAAPKFPTPHHLTYLLRWHLRVPGGKALSMVQTTLDRMWRGGIFDQVGLGFHRYSVDAQWLVPHFEKMLYDQALMAMALCEAFQLTGEEGFAQAARQVFAYVLRDMTSPGGGFYSAEDADSEGEEGLFYVWTPDQVADVLGPELGGLFCRAYNVTDQGNFEHGRSIPHLTSSLEELAGDEGLEPGDLAAKLNEAREGLFAAREKRVHPLKDDKIIASWNGLMIAALAIGARALNQPSYLEAAERAAEFIEAELRDGNGRLARRWREGHLAGQGYLDDYAFYLWGLIELHQSGLETRHLERALDLAELTHRLFEDADKGGYFYTPAGGEDLIFRDKEIYDGALPSGNSAMALNLLRLGRLVGSVELEERAEGVFKAFAGLVEGQPMAYTHLMNALDFSLSPGQEVVVVGKRGDERTEALITRALEGFAPHRVVLFKDAGADGARVGALAPYAVEMEQVGSGATAFVCTGHACQSPVNDPADMVLE